MDHLMGVTVTFCACVGPVLDNRGGWVGGGGDKRPRGESWSSSGDRPFFFLLLVTSPECEEHKLMRKHSFFFFSFFLGPHVSWLPSQTHTGQNMKEGL